MFSSNERRRCRRSATLFIGSFAHGICFPFQLPLLSRQPPFNSMGHQVPMSPPRLSAGRSVAANTAFHAIKSAEAITPVNSSDDSLGCFKTPKRVCSNRGLGIPCSPTSVVWPFDRHYHSPQAHGTSHELPCRGGSGVGSGLPSLNRKYKTEMCKHMMEH